MRYASLHFQGAGGAHTLELMIADSMLERMRGLLARATPAGSQGMLLPACRLVHTLGMRYPIDVVYLARDGHVLKVTAALTPGRIDGHWGARSVLEMGAGAAIRCGVVPGAALGWP
jgi:uncharacterized membrane protein (UPF0127 family)